MKQSQHRVPLRERNKQRIVQRITAAAFELFSSAGYDQTTMDAIADKAEVSRATLFNYFPTKDALLMPYAKELYQQHIQPAVQPYLETRPTTLQALRFLIINIHDRILTLPGMDRALQQEVAQSRSFKETEDRAAIGFHDNLVAILHYGQQRGEVRSDMPLETLTHYIGALCAFLFQRMISAQSTQLAMEVDTLLTLINTGLHGEAR